MSVGKDADGVRLARRRDALVAALTAAGVGLDDAGVAAIAAAPGFMPGPDPQDPVLAAARVRRRADLAAVLHAAPAQLRAEPEALADWLTGIRTNLVHPTTGEPMSLLDWVNRGGDVSIAQAAATTPS